MTLANPVVLAQVVGFGVFLWLGLYLLVRVGRVTMLIVTAVVALWSIAGFFASSALAFTTSINLTLLTTYERAFWWCAVLPTAAWFHFSTLVTRQFARSGAPQSAKGLPLVGVVYAVAVVLIGLGTWTNLLVDYAHPVESVGTNPYLERGPAYPAHLVYLGITTAGALINLVFALRSLGQSSDVGDRAIAQQLRLLVGGALLFMGGALWIGSRYTWDPAVSVLPGYLCLLVGVSGVGYGIARFGLLLEGQDIQRDFAYNLVGIGLLNLAYSGLLLLTGALSVPALLLLVGLVSLTHTTFDTGRRLLDRVFFTRTEQVARAEAREYATVLGTVPVPLPEVARGGEEREMMAETVSDEVADEPPDAEALALPSADNKLFKNMVRKAITNLKSPPQLALSPLLALPLLQQRVEAAGQVPNRLNRAIALRELLIEHIDALRPQADTTTRVGEAWRFYNVLYYPYVRELSRKGALAEARRLIKERQRQGLSEPGELEQVLTWLADVDEDTFYKWQRRASDTIATLLWEESRVRG